MWRTIRYDRDGRVRWWQPTIPRLAVCAAAAGLSFLVVRPGFRPVSSAVGPPPQIEQATTVPQPPAVAPCDQDPPFVVIWGRYVNFPYGYSIDLPDDAFALTSSPPCPQHGCSVDLEDIDQFATYADVWRDTDVERELWVDGSYNAAFVPSLDEAVEQTLGWKREEARDLRVLARGRTRLGRLGAARVTIEYEDCATGRRVVEEWVVAGRRELGGNTTDDEGRRIDDIRYTAGLKTTPARREEDEKVFEQVLRSWRLRPVE